MRIVFFLASLTAFAAPVLANDDWPFIATPIADMDRPWAMTFLPDGRMLITEKRGAVVIVTQDGKKSAPLDGVPRVEDRGQGGLGDIILHPDFEQNRQVYLSYAEAGSGGTRGAAVARATLRIDAGGDALEDLEVIWRQQPKVTGRGHYGHRLAFSTDGYLFHFIRRSSEVRPGAGYERQSRQDRAPAR